MFLKADKGFSLIELMVALGITGLTVTGAIAITKSSLGLQNSIHLSDDLAEMANFVRAATSRPGSCGLVPQTLLGDKKFNNINLPTIPTDLTIDSIDIPADLYMLSETDDPLTNKKSLKELFQSNLGVKIRDIELILPEAVSAFNDGERVTRGNIVVHAEKKEFDGSYFPLPPQVFETILRLDVSGNEAKLTDCGSTWEISTLDPPVIDEEGFEEKALGFATPNPKGIPLGRHSLCVIIDRGLKTGETKTGIWPGASYKKLAQRANFRCAISGPTETNEWFLHIHAEKDEGRGGEFSCKPFCI